MGGGRVGKRTAGRIRLTDWHDSGGDLQIGLQGCLCPADPRHPAMLLSRCQPGVIGIVIAQQVITAIGGQLVQNHEALRRDTINHGNGKAELRHADRADLIALSVPFCRHGIGKRAGRQQQRRAAGGPDGTLIQQDGKAVRRLADIYRLVEPLSVCHSGIHRPCPFWES